jgi:protein TonB
MSQSQSYLDARPSGRRTVGLIVAIVFHILLIYALYAGLGRKVLEIVKPITETKIIEEVKPPPPPPPEAPPPPPKLAAPPPPFIPPPEIRIANPPPAAPTITAVASEPPPVAAAPVIAKPVVEAPPAPKPAPPPPPPPKPRLRLNAKPIYTPPISELAESYPRQAAREGITGRVVVHLTVAPSGDVKDAYVKEAQPKRIFDKVAIEWVKRYKFEKGDDEFETEQEIVFKLE